MNFFDSTEVNRYLKPTDDPSVIRAIELESDGKKFDELTLLQKISMFNLEEPYRPTNNIILMMELQQDGSGDFGWIKEYIKLFNKAGYANENIYVISFFELKFNFCNPDYKYYNHKELYNLLSVLNNPKTLSLEGRDDLYVVIREVYDYLNIINQSLINSEISENKNMIRNADNVLKNPKSLNPFYNDLINIIDQILKNRSEFDILEKNCTTSGREQVECNIINQGVVIDLKNLFSEFLRFLNIFKNDSYVEGVNYILSDTTYGIPKREGGKINFFEKEENKCYLFRKNEELGFLHKSIICTFVGNSVPKSIFENCLNIKLIIMSEGGRDSNDINDTKCISSGIGKNFLGLHNSFSDIRLIDTKDEIVSYLKSNTTARNDTDFNSLSIYHYAYIGQLESRYEDQSIKYFFENMLLLNMMKNNSTEYLFSSATIINQYKILTDRVKIIFGDDKPTSGNFKDYLLYMFNLFNISEHSTEIKIIFGENYNYDIIDTSNNKILKVRYYNRLEKKYFLSMMKFSTSPVFSTGDLSTQEALLMGKYVIHDYISNKIPFIKKFNKSLVNYINRNRRSEPPLDNNGDNDEGEDDKNTFYKIFNKLRSGHYPSLWERKLKNNNITFDEIFSGVIERFEILIKYYPCYKRDIIDKIYNMDNNFINLLAIVNLYKRDNLILPKQNSFVSFELIDKHEINLVYYEEIYGAIEAYDHVPDMLMPAENEINQLLNCLWMRKYPSTNTNATGGSSKYLQKYLKYKNKYIQLKNKLKK